MPVPQVQKNFTPLIKIKFILHEVGTVSMVDLASQFVLNTLIEKSSPETIIFFLLHLLGRHLTRDIECFN